VVGVSEGAIRETVERFRAGWAALDADAVLATLSHDPALLVWGTDVDEEWRGFEALVEPFRQQAAAFSEPRYVWRRGDPVVRGMGNAGWAAGTLDVSLVVGDKLVSVPMRSTFVLQREEDEWRIAHAHFSVGQSARVAEYR
jgi:ketosteroid isomerase-like protein